MRVATFYEGPQEGKAIDVSRAKLSVTAKDYPTTDYYVARLKWTSKLWLVTKATMDAEPTRWTLAIRGPVSIFATPEQELEQDLCPDCFGQGATHDTSDRRDWPADYDGVIICETCNGGGR